MAGRAHGRLGQPCGEPRQSPQGADQHPPCGMGSVLRHLPAADKAERGTQHGAYGRMGDAERGERAAAPIGGNVPACCAGEDPAGDPVLHTGRPAGVVDTVQPVHCPALRQYGEQPDVGRRYVYAGYLHRRRERAGAQDVLICLGGRTQRHFHRLEPFGRKQEPEQRERAA